MRQLDHFAVLTLHFLDDLIVLDDLRLVYCRRVKKHKQIVSLLRRHLGSRTGADLGS